jgi:hypothetical protein
MMAIPTILRSLLKSARSWAVLVLVTVACLQLKEWFPFSHFPMYSKNREESIVLYLTDENDEVIPTGPAFGYPAFRLKKLHDTALRKLKSSGELQRVSEATPAHLAEIADEVLAFVKTGQPRAGYVLPAYAKLRLHRQRLRLADGKIVTNHELLGER